MTLRVVGAGLPRTGTTSLKLALERLLAGRCYHMFDVYEHPAEHAPVWNRAMRGDQIDWRATFIHGYVAAVDWPAAHFRESLATTYPDAVILLSKRSTPEAWWESVDATVFANARQTIDTSQLPPEIAAFGDTMQQILTAFSPQWGERDSAIEAYSRHLEGVRQAAPSGRLLEWQPSDGWEPLCAALSVAVPDEAFPHANTRGEFDEATRGRQLDQDD